MQDKLMWFPRLRGVAGAGLLALAMVVGLSTPTFAKGAALNNDKSLSMVSSQLAVDATDTVTAATATIVDAATGVIVDAATGVVIIAIDAKGPAAQAGIVRGDILLKVGDAPVNSAAALYEIVKAATPGDEVMLSVQHGDEPRTIPLILGSVASDQLSERAYLGVQVADPTGMAVAPVVAEVVAIPAERNVSANVEQVVTATEVLSGEIMTFSPGLFVAEVMADSPAAQAGLATGDLIVAIDGQSIASSDDFINALKGHTPGEVVTLTVQKGPLQKGGSVGAVIAGLPVTLGAAPDDPSQAYLGIRIVAEVPAVTVELSPAQDVFSAPAIPVPSLPALPKMTPGFSYNSPGAYAGGVCGTPSIQQYFYPPASVVPFAVPFNAPLAPMVPTQPATPTVPYYIYRSGDNAEVNAYAVSGQVGQEVILWQAQPATPWGEMRRFEIHSSAEAMQMVPTQQLGDGVSIWVNRQVPGGDGRQGEPVQKEVLIVQPQAQTQITRSGPVAAVHVPGVPAAAIDEWY